MSMDRDRVRTQVGRIAAAWNGHDPFQLALLYTSDCRIRDAGDPEPRHGREDVSARMDFYVKAFPDLHLEVDELYVDGDTAIAASTLTGTHTGPLGTIAPTGRPVDITAVAVSQFDDHGMVHHEITFWEQERLIEQLGLRGED